MKHQSAITTLEVFAAKLADSPAIDPANLPVEIVALLTVAETRATLADVNAKVWAAKVPVVLEWLRTQPDGPVAKGHRAVKHAKGCRIDHCMICDGGLFDCADCHLFEGALSSDCPGLTPPYEMGDFVYAGLIDFKDGEWVAGSGKMPCWNPGDHPVRINQETAA